MDTEPSRLPYEGAAMGDKSPRQSAAKKSSKSIKEKRADKRAAETGKNATTLNDKLDQPKKR